MDRLSAAAAYVVNAASKEGKLGKLGKTKLFKILYLADWYSYEKSKKTIFNRSWYRITQGPALKPYVWDKLCNSLSENYDIVTRLDTINYYHPQVVFEIIGNNSPKIESKDKKHLDKAYQKVINKFAKDAAKLTYETEPMQWLLVQESELGNVVQFKEFRIDDIEREKFKSLSNKYIKGKIDIPKIADEMGDEWTDTRVVFFLERIQAYRDISKKPLSRRKEKDTLSFLLNYSSESRSNSFDEAKLIENEVIASQRIEGIYVSLDAFEGEM